ncbi:MAG: energy-coupling factor transporter ATPase [Candidatus Zipacnadales bacterium]
MRDVLAVWRNTRSIVLVALSAGIYAAVLIPFKAIPLIPGFTELRPANSIPPVMSLLFGPAAAWGCALGNLIGDFFGTIGPGSIFGFVGNFLLGYLPYRLWKVLAPNWHPTGSVVQLPLFWFVSIIASVACALLIAFGVDWLGLVPYAFLFVAISLNNGIMGVVLGPILLALLYPRAARWGLLAEEVHEEEDLRNGPLAIGAAIVIPVLCVLGWVVLKNPDLLSVWVPPRPGYEGQMPPAFALTPLRAATGFLSLVLILASALLAQPPRLDRGKHLAEKIEVTQAEQALVLRDVSFEYRAGTKPALRNLSVTIEPGTFVAIMGRTGAGKSTLCRCANGLVPAFYAGRFEGEVMVFGRPVWRSPVREHAGLVGLVFQDFEAQLISSDVELEVAFAMENLGVPREEMQRRVAESLTRVGLEGFVRRDPATLSGGEKQRLALAAVLAPRPQLIVLDEPTTDLDPQGKEELFSQAQDLAREGLTVLMAEHEPDYALAADRLLVLDEGHLVYDGPTVDLLTDSERCLALGIRPPEIPRCFTALGIPEPPIDLEKAIGYGRELGLSIKEEAFAALRAQEAERRTRYGDVVIEVCELVHEYTPGTPVVEGISLTIRQGEFVALLGQNGSGKTTLAKHLNGLLKPTRGEVRVSPINGLSRPRGDDPVDRALRPPPASLPVGYVFQDPDHQIFCATVREEVAFGPRTLGLDDSHVDEALEAVGLTDLADADPFALTKGERQAVAVASALACEPSVLILDEPTTGLDGPLQERMMGLLRELNDQGRTIIVITHSMWAAASYVDRVVVMAAGKIIADGPTREVFANGEALAQASLRPPGTAQLSQALFGVTLLTPEEFGQIVKVG